MGKDNDEYAGEVIDRGGRLRENTGGCSLATPIVQEVINAVRQEYSEYLLDRASISILNQIVNSSRASVERPIALRNIQAMVWQKADELAKDDLPDQAWALQEVASRLFDLEERHR